MPRHKPVSEICQSSRELDTIELLRKKLDRQEGWQQIGSLTIHFSEDCNLRCHYCSYAEQKDRSSIDPEILDLALAQQPIYTCIVGGGEPTLVDASTPFSALVARFPQPRSVYMITNGTVMPPGICLLYTSPSPRD